MLELRESDIPVLFLVLVVLPLVAYVLLGKWSETTKRRDRITLLAQLAAEEALREEEMAVADVIPAVSSSKSELPKCARCSAPARTRCSRCKSVRYCSGNCQIIDWRQIHKQECQQLETHKSSSFPLAISVDELSHGSGFYENLNTQFFGHNLKQTLRESAPLDNLIHPLTGTGASATADFYLLNNSQVSTFERRTSYKSNRETQKRDNGPICESSIESSEYKATSSPSLSVVSKEVFMRQKSRNNDYSVLEEETSKKVNASGFGVYTYGQDASRSTIHEDDNYQSQYGNAFVPRNNYGSSSVSSAGNNDESVDEFETDIASKGGNVIKWGNYHSDEAAQYKCSSEMTIKGSVKAKKISHPPKIKGSESPKSTLKTSTDYCCPEIEKKGKITDEPKVTGIRDTIPLHGTNGAANTGIMKMMGLRKSTKLTAQASSEGSGVRCKKIKKIKMFFPYEEFVKIFQTEVFGICPRGLLNCGNRECWVCPTYLDQFLLTSLACFGEGKKPNSCGNVQSMPLFGVLDWSVILVSLRRFLWMSSYFGIDCHLASIWCKAPGLFKGVSLTEMLRDWTALLH